MIDLSISPAPWKAIDNGIVDANGDVVYEQTGRGHDDFCDEDKEFVLLMRSALDVAMRRKWFAAYRGADGWCVGESQTDELIGGGGSFGDDPFTYGVPKDLVSIDDILFVMDGAYRSSLVINVSKGRGIDTKYAEKIFCLRAYDIARIVLTNDDEPAPVV